MKTISKIENLFAVINETADLLAQECNITYIEALAETGENLFQQSILQEDLSEITSKSLKENMNL